MLQSNIFQTTLLKKNKINCQMRWLCKVKRESIQSQSSYKSKTFQEDKLMIKSINAIVAWGHATSSVAGYVGSPKCHPLSPSFPSFYPHSVTP